MGSWHTWPGAQDVPICDDRGPEVSVPSFVPGFPENLLVVLADDGSTLRRHDEDGVVARDVDLDDRAAELENPGHVNLIPSLVGNEGCGLV